MYMPAPSIDAVPLIVPPLLIIVSGACVAVNPMPNPKKPEPLILEVFVSVVLPDKTTPVPELETEVPLIVPLLVSVKDEVSEPIFTPIPPCSANASTEDPEIEPVLFIFLAVLPVDIMPFAPESLLAVIVPLLKMVCVLFPFVLDDTTGVTIAVLLKVRFAAIVKLPEFPNVNPVPATLKVPPLKILIFPTPAVVAEKPDEFPMIVNESPVEAFKVPPDVNGVPPPGYVYATAKAVAETPNVDISNKASLIVLL